MDREKAKQEIKARWREAIQMMTQPAEKMVNGEPSFICPLCNHGANGDGLTYYPKSKDGTTLHCFGSCNFTGDIIALAMEVNKWTFPEALDALADWLQIPIDMPSKESNPMKMKKTTEAAAPAAEVKKDYTTYYAECRARLTDPVAVSYLNDRGISVETARSFGVGYDPAADPAGKGYTAPRLILPCNESFYVARSVDPGNQYRYLNSSSNIGLKNIELLQDPGIETIFVVEGYIDAMAIHEAGGTAIALNSTANTNTLLAMLQDKKPTATLLLSLDKDKPGRDAEAQLRDKLYDLGIDYEVVDVTGDYKDPAEALQSDPAFLKEHVAEAMRQGKARPDNTADYVKTRRLKDCEAYNNKFLTGFSNLDAATGGMRPGLYVLAAISSLGKTTLAHQLAENMAASGQHVLYFSMEQSANELVSKSLKRIIKRQSPSSTVTTLQIMEGSRDFTVTEAENTYCATIGQNLSIIEGNLDCDIKYISNVIKKYIRRNNCKPLVIVDYLQILMPDVDKNGRRQTTKETVDMTTTELKRLSRTYGLPVLAISSVNRMNYTLPVDFEALKESGSIEFTADVVWGLQLHCLQEKIFAEEGIIAKRERVKACKAANPRELDLVCLKNRFGISSFICHFKYYTDCDTFEPWIMTLKERLAEIEVEDVDKPKRNGRGSKKPAEPARVNLDTMPTWQQLMQPKQHDLFFNMVTGKMLDTKGKEIEMTYTLIQGRKWPAINCGGGALEILSEAQYNDIIEYNRKRMTAAEPGSFDSFGTGTSETDPGEKE